MKWDVENDDQLKILIGQGKKYNEIAEYFNITPKSVSNRCFRIGLTIIHYKKYVCLNCGLEFNGLISHNRKFCSKKCSGIVNSCNRIHTEETKDKIRRKLVDRVFTPETIRKISGSNNSNWIDGRSLGRGHGRVKRESTEKLKRKCKYCKEFNIEKKYKTICDICRIDYYEVYRPDCNFKFNVRDFVNEFEFSLVEKYGWYSPSNKGNNLSGVSKDHLYSVKDGFMNKIDPKVISHPANCKLMVHSQNSKKNSKSSITIEELMCGIKNWEIKYGEY